MNHPHGTILRIAFCEVPRVPGQRPGLQLVEELRELRACCSRVSRQQSGGLAEPGVRVLARGRDRLHVRLRVHLHLVLEVVAFEDTLLA